MKKIYIITGGTMVHVAPHLSLCAPAYGTVGQDLDFKIKTNLNKQEVSNDYKTVLLPTSMVDKSPSYEASSVFEDAGIDRLETNEDLSKLVDYLIEQPDTRCIVMAAAVCDFKPEHLTLTNESGESYDDINEFGKNQRRLSSNDKVSLHMAGDEKILSKIRKNRKDIFLTSFKTTAGVGHDETYRRGLESLKKNSSNLVFANDIKDKINMVITPEEFPYEEHTREEALDTLADMIVSRIQLTFNRTGLKEGETAEIMKLASLKKIPANFAPVLRHLIDNGAYKPFRGKTSGHFGCKVEGEEFDRISSIRKVDHNKVFENGMAKIFRDGDKITAIGGKPSVGEHTQQMIYDELGDNAHSIVHFHSPKKDSVSYFPFELRDQQPYECGSNECGINTASGMSPAGKPFDGIYAVHLDNHGPNIAFRKDVDPAKVIEFIDLYWDLSQKEGGLIKELAKV